MVSQGDLSLYQGDTFGAVVTVLNTDNTPADISGYTALSHIRRAVADADPVIVVTLSAIVDSPDVNLSLTADQTEPLQGQYVWDLQLTGPSSEVMTIMRGKVMVTAEVTRVP